MKAILARLNSVPSREYIGEEVSNLIGALEDIRTPLAAIRKEIAPKEGKA